MTENAPSKSEDELLEQELNAQAAAKRITIPYNPRKHFIPLHASLKRFIFVVAHRRAGKTVTLCNKIIRAALENKRQYPPPRYAYIGPSFAQAKDLVWGYFKHYTNVLPNVKVMEGDLYLTLPNSAQINLYAGAQAYQRMRGLYFDGAVLDEFPLLNPAAWSSVVRPCLADYRGWAVVSGTSNGDDHFHELKKKAERESDSWDIFSIPVNETDALHPDEVHEMTRDMSPEEYAREMMCSFDAPVEGAYYAHILNELQTNNRITSVPHDSALRVFTWWDLGIDDETCIWFVQQAGTGLHVIDCHIESGRSLEEHAKLVISKPYLYSAHVFPHDVNARELSTGRTRFEIVNNLLGDIITCPYHRVEDGIAAARTTLRQCWFDKESCADGLSALKNYHRTEGGQPVHNWSSHPSDAFRIGAVSMNIQKIFTTNRGNVVVFRKPRTALRRGVKGLAAYR